MGTYLLLSSWGLSLPGDLFSERKVTGAKAGVSSQYAQGLTREMTLGIWEMLRPVGITRGPTLQPGSTLCGRQE